MFFFRLQQSNETSGGVKRNSAAGGGGDALHGHQGSLPAQGVEAREHRDPTRHHPHEELSHLCV